MIEQENYEHTISRLNAYEKRQRIAQKYKRNNYSANKFTSYGKKNSQDKFKNKSKEDEETVN